MSWTALFPSAGRADRYASEVKSALYNMAKKPKVIGFVISLGGRDTTVSGYKDIVRKGIDIAAKGSKNEFEIYGVRE